jgi:hypothetical protein
LIFISTNHFILDDIYVTINRQKSIWTNPHNNELNWIHCGKRQKITVWMHEIITTFFYSYMTIFSLRLSTSNVTKIMWRSHTSKIQNSSYILCCLHRKEKNMTTFPAVSGLNMYLRTQGLALGAFMCSHILFNLGWWRSSIYKVADY